jgi:hypothetical protein
MSKHSTISFCPNCGNGFKKAEDYFADEYWTSDQSVLFLWCCKCSWRGEIIKIERVTITEEEE